MSSSKASWSTPCEAWVLCCGRTNPFDWSEASALAPDALVYVRARRRANRIFRRRLGAVVPAVPKPVGSLYGAGHRDHRRPAVLHSVGSTGFERAVPQSPGIEIR